MNTIGFTKLALKVIICLFIFVIYLSVAGLTINIFVSFYKKINISNYREQCLP